MKILFAYISSSVSHTIYNILSQYFRVAGIFLIQNFPPLLIQKCCHLNKSMMVKIKHIIICQPTNIFDYSLHWSQIS